MEFRAEPPIRPLAGFEPAPDGTVAAGEQANLYSMNTAARITAIPPDTTVRGTEITAGQWGRSARPARRIVRLWLAAHIGELHLSVPDPRPFLHRISRSGGDITVSDHSLLVQPLLEFYVEATVKLLVSRGLVDHAAAILHVIEVCRFSPEHVPMRAARKADHRCRTRCFQRFSCISEPYCSGRRCENGGVSAHCLLRSLKENLQNTAASRSTWCRNGWDTPSSPPPRSTPTPWAKRSKASPPACGDVPCHSHQAARSA